MFLDFNIDRVVIKKTFVVIDVVDYYAGENLLNEYQDFQGRNTSA